MSLFIRNCLSESNPNLPKKQTSFKPFCNQRNHLGRIIKKNCVRKVITSQEILETLRMPSDQYFLLKSIQRSERRFEIFKRERAFLNEDQEGKLVSCFQELEKLVKNISSYQQEPLDSYHEQILRTTLKISAAKEEILQKRMRLKNRVLHNREVSSSVKSTIMYPEKKSSISRSTVFDSFSKLSSGKNPPLSLSKQKTFEVEQVPVFRGHTLSHKKLKRSLYNIIPKSI